MLGFILFMRPYYAISQVGDDSIMAIVNIQFWKSIFPFTVTTVANLTPLKTAWFYIEHSEPIKAAVLALASFAMFIVFAQMALAILYWWRWDNFYMPRL